MGAVMSRWSPSLAADAPFAKRAESGRANDVAEFDPDQENSRANRQSFPTQFPTHLRNQRAARPKDRSGHDGFQQVDPILTRLISIGLQRSQRDEQNERKYPHQPSR